MKIKRRSILAGTAILSTAVLGLSVANLATNGQFFKGKVFADTDCEWMHYAGTTPTATKDALREYWICCNHHEIEYTKPESANITEATHPDGFLNEIKTANPHDERILSSYDKAFTCDQIASVASILDDSVGYWEVGGNKNSRVGVIEPWSEGERGTYGVRALFSNSDCGICLRKEYAAQVFSNPSVAALEFDARGDYDTNNFRHREGDSKSTYFNGATGTGLTTHWQTFSYTREMYEAALASDLSSLYFIWGNLGGERYLYLDNFRPVAYNDKTTIGTTRLSFNNAAYPINTNATDVFVKNPYTNANVLKINTSSAGAIDLAELDNTVKTEGSASLHVHKTDNSTFVFYPTETLLNNSQTHGGISFDIMTSVTVTKLNFLCFQNRTSSYDTNGIVQLPANKWTHVTIPFNGMRDTGNQYDGLFGIINKSAMDIYVDNLRFADEDDNDILNSFEGAQVFKDVYDGGTYWQAGKQELLANTDINALNTRDYGKSQFWINGVQNVSNATIDSTHASAGAQAFRMDVETQGPVYAFYNINICNSLLPGDKLEFDVYTDASGATFGKAPTAKRSTATALTQNAWTTVSLEKTSTDQQFFRLNEETLPIGSYWFDNFRVVKNVPSEGITFENGSTSINTTEATYRDSSGKTVRISNTTTNRISAIELISDIGDNSTQMLHITKAASGYTAFYLPSDFKLQMGTNTMSFDLRTTVAINSRGPNPAIEGDKGVYNIVDGVNGLIKGEDWQHPANQWVTYTLTPEQITNDGRFMITQGSSQGEYYIDNIRINNGTEQTVEAGNITATIGQNLTVDIGYALSLANVFVLDGTELALEQYSINGTSLTLDGSLVTAGAHTLVVKQAKTSYSCDKYTINFTIVAA